MSLVKYGIAGAVGYYLGQPQGRRVLAQLRERVRKLGNKPQVKQLQERGWDAAQDRAAAAKRLVTTLPGKKKPAEQTTFAPTVIGDADLAMPSDLEAAPIVPVVDRPSPHPSTAPTDTASTGFGGRTVAEDSEAARTGLIPPPPLGRTTP